MMTALTILCASCLAASPTGCARRCGGCGPSMYAEAPGQGCPACDRYASRVYRRFDCSRPRRDPRIPGPHVLSTLPAPEREAPGYFHPVPTYPVFGPRSEEPDGIEPELQPMSPAMEGEPLPPPRNDSLQDDDMTDNVSAEEDRDDFEEEEADEPKLAAPQQSVQHAGWRPAKRQPAAAPTRPCANCSLSFRPPSSAAR